MKRPLVLSSILLTFNLCLATYQSEYAKLAQGPRYYGMSFIEIAADNIELAAIKFFSSLPSTTVNDLIKARALLEVKLDLLDEEIVELVKEFNHADYLTGLPAKIEKKRDLKKSIKNIIAHLNRIISIR